MRSSFPVYQVSVSNGPNWSETEFTQLKHVQAARAKHENSLTAFKECKLIFSPSGRNLTTNVTQQNCNENNDISIHAVSGVFSMITLVMKVAREGASIFFFGDVGYSFPHMMILRIDIPQEPFKPVWNEDTKGSRAMHHEDFRHGNKCSE